MTINDHVLKLTGKVSVPSELSIGHNYKVAIEGSITEATEKDNNDGSRDRFYKFEPVIVELIDEKGERIKAKDPRKLSQKLRGKIYMGWDGQGDFDSYYERKMAEIISNVE